MVPTLRQRIIEPLYAIGSFCTHSIQKGFEALKVHDARLEAEKGSGIFTPLDLPEKEVLFAEDISVLDPIDPLADLRAAEEETEDGVKAAEWVYLDEFTANTEGVGLSLDTESVFLTAPVFEHADLFNDGPAVLSAILRFYGITENQYNIADRIHPQKEDINVDLSDMRNYVLENYPDFGAIIRLNGSETIIKDHLTAGFPIIARIEEKALLPFYPGDDRFVGHYVLLLGFETTETMDDETGLPVFTEQFIFQNPAGSEKEEIPVQDFLSAWYPFQREYMVIYPIADEATITGMFGDDWSENRNIGNALAKFKTDAENLPENPFAWFNYGKLLLKKGNIENAWETFGTAESLGVPHRMTLYDSSIPETAFKLGYAREIQTRCDEALSRFSVSAKIHHWKGWAYLLAGEPENAESEFRTAEQIDPGNEDISYALKYLEEYHLSMKY